MKGFLATTLLNGITTYSLGGSIFPGTADLTVPIPAIQANGYTPDTVARVSGYSAANDSAAWYGGNILGTRATSIVYDPVQHFPFTVNGGKVTPGQGNILALADNSDTDNDGVPYLMETNLGMDPFKADNYKLPQPSMTRVGNVVQPALTVTRPSGGVAGLTYNVQASFNLQAWTLPTILFSTVPNSPSSGLETQIFLVHPDFLPLLDVHMRVYFRLKVQRQ